MNNANLSNPYYTGSKLAYVAYPLGGMGSGMFCLEGTGAFSAFSLRHEPNIPNEPNIFAAVTVKGKEANQSRVLEGPVPRRKIWNNSEIRPYRGKGNGLSDRNYGLSRFDQCRFHARFPFAQVELEDSGFPVAAQITGWSPFIPGDDFNSCLPGAYLEYTLTNTDPAKPVELVFYFASFNIMGLNNDGDYVLPANQGFVLAQKGSCEKPWEEGYLHISADHPDTAVNTAWFRGGWFDTFSMLWNEIRAVQCENRHFNDPDARSRGASLAVPLTLKPGESRTVRLNLCWYVPYSNLRMGADVDSGACGCEPGSACCSDTGKGTYKPWYATVFNNIESVGEYFQKNVEKLRTETAQFTDTLFASQLPSTLLEAAAANLTILKSPTLLRQHDGRLWCWEGCCEEAGCCTGTCTHVWNYAQALCHLFPSLERGLRQTEFNENQDENGHQQFRASLPIRPTPHDFYAAADGQLGGIMKVYRDWHISGDTAWMIELWPKVKRSLDYCIKTWDPDGEGVVRQPHHNTYDIEFFGPEPMCTSVYLGALKAAVAMANALGDTAAAKRYDALFVKGGAYMESKLFNGEFLIQPMDFSGIDMGDAPTPGIGGALSEEAIALIRQEGPKYQYGSGCLSDGVIGAWMAKLYGLGDIMNPAPITGHLRSIFKYNLKANLSNHDNTQRPGYALGEDGGLLLCTWPNGGKLSLPFVYSDEVWTGIEYQVASHLILEGLVEEGLAVVQTARARYDGECRNPFDEYECGHWYARALASFALLQSYAGARYDKLTQTLYINPVVSGDVSTLLCMDGGYGLAGVKDGQAFYQPIAGEVAIEKITYQPAE